MKDSLRLPSRSTYRSFRYSLNRQQNVRTADPKSLPKFRIKNNSVFQSTMMRTGGFQEMQMSKTLPVSRDEQKTQYMNNFYSLIDSQRKMSIKQRLKWQVRPSKLSIQNFQQLDQSQFTLLDPFQRHLKSIQLSCKSSEQHLKSQAHQTRQIKGQLLNLSRKITLTMNQFQVSALSQLGKFTSLIKQNAIRQQQTKLRFRQQIVMLHNQHQQNQKKFNQILSNNHNLQEVIFNCQPYQLTPNQEWKKMENTATTLGIKDGTLC